MVRGWDHHARDYATCEAALPVSQDPDRHPADRGQNVGDHRQGGRGFLIGGEAHEQPGAV
jgi:hypothetical protein